jgi:predicted ATP-dependent protease
MAQMLNVLSTVSLEPEPVALDVKVVLVGERLLYYLLYAHDPEFAELFKVVVDFDEDLPRAPENAREMCGARSRRRSIAPTACETAPRSPCCAAA